MKGTGILLVLLMLLYSTRLLSISGDEAVEKFRGRMLRLEKLTGVISWTSLEGQTYSGSFKYLAPGKIYIKFSSPSEEILVTDGRTLWIYSPGTKRGGIQELAKDATSGGIAALVAGYSGIAAERDAGYTLKLKKDESQYSEIILSVDATFLLKGAIFKLNDGRIISFSLSDISTTAEVRPSLFNFKIPKGVQIVNSPLIIRSTEMSTFVNI